MSEFKNKLALEASAGSGKTFALVVRYITLLFLGANPKEILALTFTNKAANEMKVRIFQTLKELDENSRRNELAQISKDSGFSKGAILEKRVGILDNFIKSEIKISTIDSFLGLILRQFSFEVNLMGDFEIDFGIDETIYNTFLQKAIKEDIYKELLHLSIYENSKLELIFGLFFSLYEKDSEIKNLKFEFSEFDDSEVMKSYEQLQADILLDNSITKRAKGLFEKVNNIKGLQNSSWIGKDSLISHSWLKKYSNEFRENLFIKIKDELNLYIQNYEKRFFYNLSKLYQIYKYSNHIHNRELNKVTFNDVTNLVYRIALKIPQDFINFRLDSSIKHILLDEFQDTSVVQYKILEPFFKQIDKNIKDGKFQSIFFVGDKKQSIYRFRGGAKELFDYFLKSYDIKKENLNYNYRSFAKIVEFVNDIFINKIKNYQPQISIDSKNRGYICVEQNDEIVKTIVEKVDFLIQNGISENEIAILTHTNSDSFAIEEQITQNLNIKVVTETSSLLINHKTVQTIIEFLKYLYFNEEIYKINFLALIGENLFNGEEFEILKELDFDISTPLPKLTDKIITTFSLLVDNSVLKFIELLYNYRDIEEFIYQYKKIVETVDKKQSDGVKILTIHKSKGLEFKYVIVSDRLGRGQSNNQTILYDYNEIELQKLYKREKNRQFFDENYKRVIDKEAKLSYDDKLNAQYVAFTRAEKSLIIIKKEKSSFDNLNLNPCEIGELEICENEIIKTDVKDFDYPFLNNLQKIEQNSFLEQNKISVSVAHSQIFGTATHYLLEMLYQFDKKSFEMAFFKTQNRFALELNEEEFLDIKDRVLKLLDNDFFVKLYHNSKIYKEQPIFYNGEKKIIDLMLIKREKIVLIDYKTSEFETFESKKQLRKYKEAIKKIYGRITQGYLCYLNKDKINFIGV